MTPKKYCYLTGALLFVALLGTLCVFDSHALASCGPALAVAPGLIFTTEEMAEFRGLVGDLKADWSQVKTMLQEYPQLKNEVNTLRRANLGRSSVTPRRRGHVSDECAAFIGAAFVVGNARAGKFDVLDARTKDALLSESRNILGMNQKTALTTTDVPLPTQFFSELRELISEFGVARNRMMRFPIGQGTAKPPRFKTRPTFGSIAMSAAFPEKSPQIEFASLESHKIGGIVRVPREIDEQSIVPMGQFLARYGAIEFARAEDTWGFLADGSGTYETVKGIAQIATDNSKTVTTATGLTAPDDTTLAHYRTMRTLVNPAVLNLGSAAYYLHSTMEVHLRTLNTTTDPYAFIPDRPLSNDAAQRGAHLDGFPIVWTDVLQAYSTSAQVNKYVAVFGALDYWWMGEHGNPRMDFSSDVYFTTDELGTRFIEEIDFDYQDVGATSALRLAAS
jgi:HK97 family phage major capsid protein